MSPPSGKATAVSNHGGKRGCVAYYRVSTINQQISGLGLEAQRAAVHAYASFAGRGIIAEHMEAESGARADRPELAAALAACQLHRATLVIAKLDRLSRNAWFVGNLLESGIDFVACDMPDANRFTIQIFSALAEHERTMISDRTRAALAAAKARGVRLGNPNGAAALRAGCAAAASTAAANRRAEAHRRAAAVAPLLAEFAANGVVRPADVALALNRRGIPAPAGGVWYAQQARRLQRALSGDSATIAVGRVPA